MRTGTKQTISLELRNGTDVDLKSLSPYPIHLSYHWLRMDGQHEVFGGHRTQLNLDSEVELQDRRISCGIFY
jgi:hypothetical protein